MEKPPAFQFYPSDFLSDENVVLMNNAEVGCYIKLLCFCWKQGSIPGDVVKLAKLCNEESDSMAQLWTAIKPCFQNGDIDGRLVHQRLKRERQKQDDFRQERSESGKKGADIRWKKKKGGSGIAQPLPEPLAKNGSSSSSSLIYIQKCGSKKDDFHYQIKVPFPPQIFLTERMKEYVKIQGCEDPNYPAQLFEDFRNHHKSAGKKFVDWTTTFQTWVRNDKKFYSPDKYKVKVYV